MDLSIGKRIPTVPQRLLGRDLWWWGSGSGPDEQDHRRLATWPTSGRPRSGDRGRAETARQAVRRSDSPAATTSNGRTVTFEDGSSSEFAAIVWATGFKVDHSWIDIPDAKDEQGHIRQKRGVTPSPGLYTLGLSWQHTRASALLGWVGDDAAFLGERIARASPTDPVVENDRYPWRWSPAAISMAMMAATTKSTAAQNGGHQRVLATKWVRCCHQSLSPWPARPITSSHGEPVTPAAATPRTAPATPRLDGDYLPPTVGDSEPDVDERDPDERQRVDGRRIEPPERERRCGLDPTHDDPPPDGGP